MLAIVEELLARDLVVLDRVDADLFESDPLAGRFGRDFEGEVDGELVGPVEEGTADLFAPDGVFGLPLLGLLDNRCLVGGFLAADFDRNDVASVHRVHQVEVLALVAQYHKLTGNCFKDHGELLSKRTVRCAYPTLIGCTAQAQPKQKHGGESLGHRSRSILRQRVASAVDLPNMDAKAFTPESKNSI